MKVRIIISVIAISLTLNACSGDTYTQYKEKVGGFFGAITGGFIGSKVGKGNGKLIATGAGAVIGAMAGSAIGRQLDNADLMYHRQAVEESYTRPLNKTIYWENDDTGHSGSVTPIREGYQASTGNLCRQYEHTITVAGQTETAVGTACQNYDGTWKIAY